MGSYRHEWCPGNATRYDLILSDYFEENSDGELVSYWVLCWMLEGGAGGKAFRFRTNDYIHYTYLLEKMGINEGDAPGILTFIEELGVGVGYPSWFEKSRLSADRYKEAKENFRNRQTTN